MAYCTQCGTEVASDASFCNECGNSVEAGDESVEEIPSVPEDTGFRVKHAVIAVLLGLIPALLLGVLMPTPDLAGIAILAGIPLFAYLGYQRPTTKTMAGRLSFWMAILLFSSPVMMMIYTSVFVSNEAQGTAEEAGAAIGGTVLIGAAFVIGLPLGIAFYLLSNRWDLDDA